MGEQPAQAGPHGVEGPRRRGPRALLRWEHLWVLWLTATLLIVSVLVRWGWRAGWWAPQAELVPGSAVEYRIDLNGADEAELVLLPGIGEVKARRIVAYRDEHGPFRRVEDLLAVQGVSESVLGRLRPYVSAGVGRDEGEEP